ncbi:hypothetical protein BGX23_011847, partial [Mortierella sp. AD031]
MSVESGLDLLKNLKRLEMVDVRDMETYMGHKKERKWVKENWPQAGVRYYDTLYEAERNYSYSLGSFDD